MQVNSMQGIVFGATGVTAAESEAPRPAGLSKFSLPFMLNRKRFVPFDVSSVLWQDTRTQDRYCFGLLIDD